MSWCRYDRDTPCEYCGNCKENDYDDDYDYDELEAKESHEEWKRLMGVE